MQNTAMLQRAWRGPSPASHDATADGAWRITRDQSQSGQNRKAVRVAGTTTRRRGGTGSRKMLQVSPALWLNRLLFSFDPGLFMDLPATETILALG